MKKVSTVAIAATMMMGLTACGDAGKGVSSRDALISPEKVYEVDGWGSNPDIYEFTPVGHEHMTCLMLVSGGDKAAGLNCFPKKPPSQN